MTQDPGRVAHTWTLKIRETEAVVINFKYKAIPGYLVNSRPTWAAQWDSVSTNNKKEESESGNQEIGVVKYGMS